MKNIFKTYRPEGFSTLNAYLFTAEPESLIDFLKVAFYAKEINRTVDAVNGSIRNAILKIGDSCFMISPGKGQFEKMRTAFYLFVNDVDAVYQNAMVHGAKEVYPPADMDYGDRQAGVIDPAGNYWWISMRLKEENYRD